MDARELASRGLGHRLRGRWNRIHTATRLCHHQFVCRVGLDTESFGLTNESIAPQSPLLRVLRAEVGRR